MTRILKEMATHTNSLSLVLNPAEVDLESLHPDTQLLVEIESISRGVVVAGLVIPDGKTQHIVLAKDLAKVGALVEPEPQEWAKAKNRFETKAAAIKASVSEPKAQKLKLHLLSYEESAPKLFRGATDRDPKPFMAVTVLASKGILPTVQNRSEAAMESLAESKAAQLEETRRARLAQERMNELLRDLAKAGSKGNKSSKAEE